jgi:hypothetical protein
MKVLAATLAALAVAAGGYLAGASAAPDPNDAGRAATTAEQQAYGTFYASSSQTARANGRSQGRKAGRKLGARKGKSAGAAAGKQEVEAQAAATPASSCPDGLEYVGGDPAWGVPEGCFAREGASYDACVAAGGWWGQPPEYSVVGGRPICIPDAPKDKQFSPQPVG